MTRQANDKFVIRFPDGLRDEIKDAAADNQRSMNSEILARIMNNGPTNRVQSQWTPQIGMAVRRQDDGFDVIDELEVFNNQLWARLKGNRSRRHAVNDLKPYLLSF